MPPLDVEAVAVHDRPLGELVMGILSSANWLAGRVKLTLAGTVKVVAPVPVRLIVCGLPAALSVIAREAVREPVAEGVKVTLIVQLAPAATLVPQVFVCAKSPLLVPVTAMLVMLSAAVPLFVSVTVCAALVVPTA